jgi:hypothetical protein
MLPVGLEKRMQTGTTYLVPWEVDSTTDCTVVLCLSRIHLLGYMKTCRGGLIRGIVSKIQNKKSLTIRGKKLF